MPVTKLDVGIHSGVPELIYHSDPCVEISASGSILKTLHDRSPLHAWYDHSRLNPSVERKEPTDFQIAGTILHSLILGTPEPHAVLDYADYRSNAAKDARKTAISAGLVPVLAHKMEALHPVATALRTALERDHALIWSAMTDADTQQEVTLVWREDGTMCRCRFDALPAAKHGFSVDLKFTSRAADPEGWSRRLRDEYLFQADLYPRAVRALRGDTPTFLFVVCEIDPPYGVSVHALGPQLADVAKRRLDRSLATWARCMRENRWPGYSSQIHYADAPSWLLMQEDVRDAQYEEIQS